MKYTTTTSQTVDMLMKLCNDAVLINYKSRFCYYVGYFLLKVVSESYICVLFSCNMRNFVTSRPPFFVLHENRAHQTHVYTSTHTHTQSETLFPVKGTMTCQAIT